MNNIVLVCKYLSLGVFYAPDKTNAVGLIRPQLDGPYPSGMCQSVRVSMSSGSRFGMGRARYGDRLVRAAVRRPCHVGGRRVWPRLGWPLPLARMHTPALTNTRARANKHNNQLAILYSVTG